MALDLVARPDGGVGAAAEPTGPRTAPRAPAFAALLLLVTALLPAAARDACAQSVRARLSADSVAVGDRFSLSVVAEYEAGLEPIFPAVRGDTTTFGDLTILAERTRARQERGTAFVDSVVYEVTTFALDTAYVPPLTVRFAAGPDTVSAASDSLVLPVVSLVPEDAQEPRDLAPLVDFPAPIWPWVLLALGVLIAAALLYYAWRRRRRAGEAPETEPPLPSAFDEAVARLRALESVDLTDPASIKPYYVALSDVLRRYLARRTGVNAMEHTTRELVSDLRRHPLVPERSVTAIRTLLELADFAKFADGQPGAERSRRAREETRALLDELERELRPPEPAPGEADDLREPRRAPAGPAET